MPRLRAAPGPELTGVRRAPRQQPVVEDPGHHRVDHAEQIGDHRGHHHEAHRRPGSPQPLPGEGDAVVVAMVVYQDDLEFVEGLRQYAVEAIREVVACIVNGDDQRNLHHITCFSCGPGAA